MEEIRIGGARQHNLKNVSLTLPRNALVVLHRRERLGQIVARLRHALRRGPAPLRRKPLHLRAAIPRADGKARRRFHRGPFARHRHRAAHGGRQSRARPSPPRPKSTISCGSSSPISASRIIPRPASRCGAGRCSRWSTASWPRRKARRSRFSRRSSRSRRASFATWWRSCAARDSSARAWTARSSNWSSRRGSTSRAPTPSRR